VPTLEDDSTAFLKVSGNSNSAKERHIREDANLLGIHLLQEDERL